MTNPNSEKTSMGMSENIAAMLCYSLGWISGLIFFLMESENRFVRFHAMQSMITFGLITVVFTLCGFVPILGAIIASLLWLITLAIWITLLIKAYQHSHFKLPYLGDIAEEQAESFKI